MSKRQTNGRTKKGAPRMVQLGWRPVQAMFRASDYERLKAAAQADNRSIAQFVRLAVLRAADVVIGPE